jgi:hypothetical protein
VVKRSASATSRTRPPHGAVVITRVDGGPSPRFRLSLFPTLPRFEVPSAKAAWALAQRFASQARLDIWTTTDGVTFWQVFGPMALEGGPDGTSPAGA